MSDSNCWMDSLPDEILEKILCYLDFSSLIASEMTCKRWQMLINERRLFWQLAKNIAKSEVIKKNVKKSNCSFCSSLLLCVCGRPS